MDSRLPAHLEVGAIRRLAESQGGFATVLSRGERDAGTIAIVIIGHDKPDALFERMPQLDGTRAFVRAKEEDIENKQEFTEYLNRRRERDPDLWLIEVNVADEERFIAALPG